MTFVGFEDCPPHDLLKVLHWRRHGDVGFLPEILITSALFRLMHGSNTLYAIVPVFVVGLVFGYVWQRTGGNTTNSIQFDFTRKDF